MTINRQETVETFCQRLTEIIERSGLSRSAFAGAVGLDRSTLSQLLSTNNDRLPRAETIVAIAAMAQVSVDWLLGLSQQSSPDTELVSNSLQIESGVSLPMDERLQRWRAEALGYKIRYVPSTLPDLLKNEDIIRYEYQDHDVRMPDLRIEQSEAQLAYSRRPENDMEVCSSFQSIGAFIRGEGIWRDLPLEQRRNQLQTMLGLVDELYPSFRWFLYDGRRRFSAPYTIFGPKRAAVYLGNMYFVFNATEQIRVLSRHFDDLIRAATIQPTEVSGFMRKLMEETG
jgi:transcriptional regulator with XRE-family HTH domain